MKVTSKLSNFKVLVFVFILAFFIALYLHIHTNGNQDRAVKYHTNGVHDSTKLNGDTKQRPYTRVVNTLLTSQYPELSERFDHTVQKRLPADDPAVVSLVQDLMDPPIYNGYRLSNRIRHTPQSEYLFHYFINNGMTKVNSGFFIECGALEGERSSNTLPFEYHHNWTGLLIEADPYFYTQLLGKGRNAWSINACLSPSEYTMWVEFHGSTHGTGKVVNGTGKSDRAIQVPCFPLESLLLALGQTKVDFFSLDVEGLEMPILNSIPHSRLDIGVWTIEYPKLTREQEKLVELMAGYGYEKTRQIGIQGPSLLDYSRDFVFVKKQT